MKRRRRTEDKGEGMREVEDGGGGAYLLREEDQRKE